MTLIKGSQAAAAVSFFSTSWQELNRSVVFFRAVWEVTGNWCTRETLIRLLHCNSPRPVFPEVLSRKQLHSAADCCGCELDLLCLEPVIYQKTESEKHQIRPR